MSRPTTGACYDFLYPSTTLKKPQGRNLKCQIFIQHFFKIVLLWCLDLIRHNIDTDLKHNKYIFDISITFCHHLYLSATLKQCFTEFAVSSNVFHHVYMQSEIPLPSDGFFFRLTGAAGRRRALHTENNGLVHATLPWHIPTFRGYRILFSIRNP